MDEPTRMIDHYAQGRMTFEQLRDYIRTFDFAPDTRRDFEEKDPTLPNTWHSVKNAFTDGKLSEKEYFDLFRAAYGK